MRFGKWRGVGLAVAAGLVLSLALVAGTVRAELFHVIPKTVPAVDVHTGGPYFAPPIPYGCYAKDPIGSMHNCIGLAKGLLHGGLCGHCGGKGCDDCGGDGCADSGDPCGACSGQGCGFCHGLGLFRGLGHGHGDPCGGSGLCGGAGCSLLHGRGKGLACGGIGKACTVSTSAQAPVTVSPQGPIAAGQCGESGCSLNGKHRHLRGRGMGLGRGCGLCGGRGCGSCLTGAGRGNQLCGGCGGRGCGLCGGRGLFGGDPCGSCGGAGCGMCKGQGGRGCGACGGAGCKLCAIPSSLVSKLLHRGEIKWFVGPGGPVPLTPGYVPYVVTTRSPRDFLAFPPFVDMP